MTEDSESQPAGPHHHEDEDDEVEEEFYLDSGAAGDFLVEVGEQLRDGETVTIEGDRWEIPFAFQDPVEVEVEYEDDDPLPELEIEVELTGYRDEDAPDVS